MSERSLFTTAGTTGPSNRRFRWVAGVVVFLSLPLVASGETYLDAIQTEAAKLDGGDTEEPASPAESPSDDPQAAFERELEERYRGSYLFYKKLPAKSQEEVFNEYEGGASIEDVRKKIMSRFLHSR